MQSKVTEFVDLVDQAERAHFGVEESFGYGKPPSQPQLGNNMPQLGPRIDVRGNNMPQIRDMGPGSMSGGSGIASLLFKKSWQPFLKTPI